MDGTEDCGDRTDSETVAALRARLALLTPGSPERREAEADLAGVLVDEAWRAAGRTDGAGTDVDEQEWERQVRCLLAEPEELLGRLLAAGPAAPGHRRLCWLSVQAARLRWEVGGGPRALDAYVAWAEQAAAPAGAYGAEEPAPAGIVAATCELAEALLLRWKSGHGDGSSAADRDRVVALLAPVLAGPDAGLVPLPATAHAHLGLALSGRCRGPHHATAAALADRAAAIAHLGAAHDAHQAWESSGGGSGEELPPGLADAVVMDLAMLRWAAQADLCEQYGDRGETAPASETAAELTALLALLRPLLADPTEDGGSAAELGADIADLLAAHVPDAAGQRAAVAAYRDALAHPALAPDERRRAGLNLGLVLGERAERNASGQTPGDPAPHEDRADALAVLGPALDAAEDREERLAGLAAAVQVGFALLEEGRLDRAGLDRLAAEARELADGVAPDDGDRAEIMLKAGIALSQRAFAAAAPHSGALGEQVLRDGTPDPALAVERLAPQVAADLRDAVALLRTGTGLYHYQDGLYVAAVTALGNALVLDFTIRLPEVRLPVLYDGLRVLRVALEQLTPDDELYGDQGLVHVFLTALMYRIWYSGPFADAHSDGAGPALPDVAGHASVEDDLQLLSGMLESRTGQAEPAVVLVSALVAAIRAADGDPASDELRSWQLPLLHAAGRTAPEEGALQIVMLAVSGAFGLLLDRGGEASAAERAAAFDALRRARALLAPGSALAGRIAPLLQETGADPRAVLGLILGRAAAPQQPPARPAAPPDSPGTGGDRPDPAGAGRGAARGPVLRAAGRPAARPAPAARRPRRPRGGPRRLHPAAGARPARRRPPGAARAARPRRRGRAAHRRHRARGLPRRTPRRRGHHRAAAGPAPRTGRRRRRQRPAASRVRPAPRGRRPAAAGPPAAAGRPQ